MLPSTQNNLYYLLHIQLLQKSLEETINNSAKEGETKSFNLTKYHFRSQIQVSQSSIIIDDLYSQRKKTTYFTHASLGPSYEEFIIIIVPPILLYHP